MLHFSYHKKMVFDYRAFKVLKTHVHKQTFNLFRVLSVLSNIVTERIKKISGIQKKCVQLQVRSTWLTYDCLKSNHLCTWSFRINGYTLHTFLHFRCHILFLWRSEDKVQPVCETCYLFLHPAVIIVHVPVRCKVLNKLVETQQIIQIQYFIEKIYTYQYEQKNAGALKGSKRYTLVDLI